MVISQQRQKETDDAAEIYEQPCVRALLEGRDDPGIGDREASSGGARHYLGEEKRFVTPLNGCLSVLGTMLPHGAADAASFDSDKASRHVRCRHILFSAILSQHDLGDGPFTRRRRAWGLMGPDNTGEPPCRTDPQTVWRKFDTHPFSQTLSFPLQRLPQETIVFQENFTLILFHKHFLSQYSKITFLFPSRRAQIRSSTPRKTTN